MERKPRLQLAGYLAALAIVGGVVMFGWPGRHPGRAPTPPDAAAGEAPIPKIDVHVHVAPALAGRAVSLLEANGVMVSLNASGGVPGAGLELSSRAIVETSGRLLPYCNFNFGLVENPRFPEYTDQTLAACKRLGGKGLKVFKALGLGIMLSDGSLLAIDDPRLDHVFDMAADLGLPVLIHIGDPQAFFRPATPDNERFEELTAHPGWSFHGQRPEGGAWPSWNELFAQFERRVARHPRTRFIGAHFGNAPEEPERVSGMLERHPNYYVETAARIPEIGRHSPAQMRAIFERWQDRILFGTDLAVSPDGLTLGSRGREPDTVDAVPRFFEAHWRYFETSGRRMAHPTPIQGRWTIDGIALPRAVLEKLYWRNAARLFGINVPGIIPPAGGR